MLRLLGDFEEAGEAAEREAARDARLADVQMRMGGG